MLYEKMPIGSSEIHYGYKNLWIVTVKAANLAAQTFIDSNIVNITLNGAFVTSAQLAYLYDYNRDLCCLGVDGNDSILVTLTGRNENGYSFYTLLNQSAVFNGILSVTGSVVNNSDPRNPIINQDDTKEDKNNKGEPNGYASLDADGKVHSSQLDIVDETDSTETEKPASANSVRLAKEEAIAAIPETYDAVNITQSAIALPEGVDPNVDEALRALNENLIVNNQISNRIYEGVDLTVKFALEIGLHSNVWAWIKSRIQAANWVGINVGDYIPWKSTNGYDVKSEIVGINTYKGYGDIGVGNHVDFISHDCWPEPIQWNLKDFNNGTSVSSSPWLACNAYAKLNSLQMSVPNAATANPALITVDYRTTGVLDKLPPALQSVITTKRLRLPLRDIAGSLLTNDNTFAMADAGKLWLPAEVEIFGTEHFGSRNGYSGGGFQQYTIFANNMKRVKNSSANGKSVIYLLMSASGNYSTQVVVVEGGGIANSILASSTFAYAPICFRISA